MENITYLRTVETIDEVFAGITTGQLPDGRWFVTVMFTGPIDVTYRKVSLLTSGNESASWAFPTKQEAEAFAERMANRLRWIPATAAFETALIRADVRYLIDDETGLPAAEIQFHYTDNAIRSGPLKSWCAASRWANTLVSRLRGMDEYALDDFLTSVVEGEITTASVPEADTDSCSDSCLCLVEEEPVELVAVGADPEFELVSPAGNIVCADGRISDPKARNRIGVDEAGYQIEFRPEPGTPEELVANLGDLFAKFAELFEGYQLSPKGDTFAIGGHIHFGFSRPIGVVDANTIVRAIDYAIGDCLEQSGMARGRYKVRAAWRFQRHGIEYRTPPASIWSSPLLALAALKIAWYVVDKICKTGRFIPEEFSVDQVGLAADEKAIWEAYLAGDIQIENVLDPWLESGCDWTTDIGTGDVGAVGEDEEDDRRLVEFPADGAMPSVRHVTCKLPAIGTPNVIGFLVWRWQPHYYIPASMAVNYTPAGQDTYWVTLAIPEAALAALEERRGELWDRDNDLPLSPDDSDFTDAIDPRAALFWLIQVRGGVYVRVGDQVYV